MDKREWRDTQILMPNEKQIANCALMGWEHLGDGVFYKNQNIGYFTRSGWYTE